MFTREQKFLIAGLALIQFNHIVDFMILMPLGPQLMRLFNITPAQFGWLVSSYTFCAAISSFASALIMDRFDRKKCLLVFFFGFTVGTIACGLAPSYELLMLARSSTGLFGGVLSSLVMSIISDAIPYQKRGTAMGFLTTAFSFASVAGVPFSLYLANHFSWHAPFFFLGLLCVVNLFLIWFRIPSMSGHIQISTGKNPLTPLLQHLTSTHSLLPLFFIFVLMMGQFAIIPFLSPSMVANGGMTEEQLPLIYLVGGLLTMGMNPFFGWLSDKVGKHKVFWIANFLCIVPIILITQIKNPMPLFLLLTITGSFFVLGGGRMGPAMTLVTGSIDPQKRGSFMSLVSSAQQLSAAVGSFIAGLMIVRTQEGHFLNYDLVGYMCVAFSLIAFFLSFKIKATEVSPPVLPEAPAAAD